MAKLPTKIIWAPTLAFHDPDPPLRIESSVTLDGSLTVTDNLGSFNASSSADANSSWFSSGGAAPEFFGYEGVPVEGSWFGSGNNGSFSAFADAITVDAMWFASGGSSGQFYGERAYTARCEGAFTYDPIGGPAWDGTLRRDPEFLVQTQSNDSPSQSTFTDEEEPALGQNVQLDMQDGHGIILGGTVQSYVTRYQGLPTDDHLVFDTTVADYLWLLNKRRPFGCFTDVPADIVAQALRVGYAPPDFSGAGIVPGLPRITVSFDGSLDYSGCMSVITARIAGHFRVDKDKVISLFLDDPAPGPDPIDDDNELLIRDQPLTITRDASQLRNRVFVKGSTAKLMADSSIGATELEIDGLDVFNQNGGEAIIGCDRFTYGGVLKTLVYPPPDASLTIGPHIVSSWLISPGNIIEGGPIRTTVRYSSSLVFNGKEGPRSAPSQENVSRYNPGFSVSGTFLPFAGFLPPGAHVWLCAFRDSGGLLYNLNIGRSGGGGFVLGAMELNWNAGSGISNDVRPVSVVLFRKADIPGGDPGPPGNQNGWYYEVASQPYFAGVTAYSFTDGKADESLGNAAPWDDGALAFLIYDTIGSRVEIFTRSARITAFNNGAQQLKIYREEKYNGPFDNTWTEPQVCMSFNTTTAATSSDPVSHEDLKATTAHLYAFGEEPSNNSTVPPAPKPKERIVLSGVSGLDEAHFEGDQVSIFMQLDDLQSQLDAAVREGGDGLHEFMVVDGSLRSDAELAARGNAELTLFKDPIVTVSYSSFDSKHTPGGTVEFNLTRPSFVASLKITEVRIDKIHFDHGHVARYNVTASSVKFTLQDLLRRTILRPY